MRMPKNNEDLTNKVCVCSDGRIFIVTGRHIFNFGLSEAWVGLGLDGKGIVACISPCIVAESGQKFHDRLLDRFGGKISYNG